MSLLTKVDRDAAIREKLQSDVKVYLTCPIHNWTYGSKKPWNFSCKQCTYASFLGLIMSLPPNRRDEMLDALEEGIHHMVESAERGELQTMEYLKHPEVSISKE
jgi:hypothetical protein